MQAEPTQNKNISMTTLGSFLELTKLLCLLDLIFSNQEELKAPTVFSNKMNVLKSKKTLSF